MANVRPICSRCLSEAQCYCSDVSRGNDFIDRFLLHCPNCGYTDFHDEYGGTKDCPSEETQTVCCFCGKTRKEHKETPPNLQKS